RKEKKRKEKKRKEKERKGKKRKERKKGPDFKVSLTILIAERFSNASRSSSSVKFLGRFPTKTIFFLSTHHLLKAKQSKSKQIKANQSKSKQIKANQSKSKQIKANQSKS